jgi:hypothetical protein
LNSGGSGGTDESAAAMTEAQSNIESTEAVLAALIDGGDTEALDGEVESSIPPETGEVYEELMNRSPYLSEIVVETSIEKEEVLPNSMLRDIMVANPHTAQSLQLLNKLDDRFDPMPAYMKAQILAGRSIQSLKSELEGQLAGYRMDKARAMNKIARYFGETPGDPAASDSLLALYENDSDLDSRYMLAWLHLQRSEYQQGQAVMNAIPSASTFTEDEEAEYQDMQTLYGMTKDLAEAGNTIQNLDQSQVNRLHDMVNGENGLATVYARNILLALDEMQYNEPVILPDNFKTSEAIDAYNELMDSRAPKKLEVFPNPGKDFVILAYQLDKESEGMIEIRDMLGKPVQNIPLSEMQNQVTVITTSWNPGIYTISLKAGGETVETVKFTLVK